MFDFDGANIGLVFLVFKLKRLSVLGMGGKGCLKNRGGGCLEKNQINLLLVSEENSPRTHKHLVINTIMATWHEEA